jgi:hypothetical protein
MDGWMERWMEDGRRMGLMEDGRMEAWMDGVLKNIKIGDYIYAKNIMKVEGGKYIPKKNENNLGIYFLVNLKYISMF